MKPIHALAGAAIIASATIAANSGTNVRILPDPKLTPGATDSRITQANIKTTICVPGYTKTVRPSQAIASTIKRNRMRAYGYTKPQDWELDHFEPLELGGDPASILNLWPEPWESKADRLAKQGTGAESKDAVENRLHREVCTGKITLKQAQSRIRKNWQTAK